MITHELNATELKNLLVDLLYEGASWTEHEGYFSLMHPETMTYAFVWTTPHTIVGLTKDRYDTLMQDSEPFDGFTPVIIVGTSEGIYEFNMDILKVEWEPYSDGDSPDILVTDLALSQGKHILPFYPEFASEDDYFDSLMSDATPSAWDESDMW